MHPDLVNAFNKLVQILKADVRCKGGWQYGSLSRGEEDIYSDYDPVFLVDDRDFESFAAMFRSFLHRYVMNWSFAGQKTITMPIS